MSGLFSPAGLLVVARMVKRWGEQSMLTLVYYDNGLITLYNNLLSITDVIYWRNFLAIDRELTNRAVSVTTV
jgi:hypothetical protein